MLKRMVVLAFLFFGVPVLAVAQSQHTFSLWGLNQQHTNGFTWMPWFTYDGDVSIDTRYNFDGPETGALLIGKRFNQFSGGFTEEVSVFFTPYIGLLAGTKSGITVQAVQTIRYERFDLMLWGQYAWLRQATGRDFFYGLCEASYRVTGDPSVPVVLMSGIGLQKYHERGQPRMWDIGPFIKINATDEAISIKLWVTWNPQHSGNRKVFMSLDFPF